MDLEISFCFPKKPSFNPFITFMTC